ncbi:RNA 3'-terminal phosphate cyclase [Halobaculum marinum]|uniref:RNA 3'-terminal phosphate cyclase n=1 Tax=Halobaculum marinum TaxID=3031996 RepID=A0ABD5WW15_9EURY|nr:RNA 3'-terminal phosphate cyclase [Halobaculum sp. DT55]
MITIDGRDGGGQVLRTALSLSVILERPFRIEHIRGNRPTPGLKPQHLTAVEVVTELCDGTVSGAELESDTLRFEPGDARETPLDAAIGTAGSIPLLFDTVLPIGAFSAVPLRVTATGGTDVKWSPTVAYQQLVKLPLLATWGVEADVEVKRTGFYPAGDGKAVLQTRPSSVSPLTLEHRGAIDRVDIYSKATESLRDARVAQRQADRARAQLTEAGLRTTTGAVEYVRSRSTGSSLLLRVGTRDAVAGFSALGERGRSSEQVADDAVEQVFEFRDATAPVDRFMADQLMLFLALAGGRVRIPAVTDHVRTNRAVLEAFGSDVHLDSRDDGTHVLSAAAHPAL